MVEKTAHDELVKKNKALSQELESCKEREKALREAESYYRAFFDFGVDGIVILDPKTGRPIDFNDQACRQLGYSREEFAQLTLQDIEVKETAEAIRAHIREIVRNGFDNFETLHRTKDGKIRHVHVSAQVIRIGTRQIYHCIWRDITERKLAEGKFQIAFNKAPIGIMLTNGQSVVVDCNEHFAHIFGMQRENYIGMNLLSRIPPGPVRQNLADAISDGKRHHYEGPYVSILSGKKTYLSISTEKAAEDLFITIMIDVTERKLAEDALRESDEKFRLTFNFSPDSVNVNRLDDGLYVEINEGFSRITGYTQNDVIGKTSLELDIWHDPADRQRLVQELREKGFVENLEAQFRRKDGRCITGLMSARLISLKGIPHIISISRDITERKRHQDEQLKIEKLESLGILAGGIAHDFNNILTGIMGNMSLAKVFLDSTHKAYTLLSEAEKAAARAGDLAHQLLTFARGGEPVKMVVSLRRLADEALSFILRGSNVKGVADIPDTIHAVEVDEGQMTQVFHNIILNATQAMPEGGLLTITAENQELDASNTLSLPPGSYVVLNFADQGCGITDETRKRIFDPYFTTKQAGIGLGLSSAHSIVSRHGGHIGASSRVGAGTTFTIHLPSMGMIYKEYQQEASARVAGGHNGGSVLVMDDDEMIRNIASSILTHLGYNVTLCKDGEEAVALYTASVESGSPFVFVIMDLTIPGGIGGRHTAEKILSRFPDACLVVSSGYSNDPIMSNYREYGFRGAIAKPYNISKFKDVLGSLLIDG